MKQAFATTLAIALTVCAVLIAQAPHSTEALLKAAQHKEEVEGDLRGAIEEYKTIAEGGDRALAARALLHMAECYLKMGDAEAQNIYERIVREYSDQKDAAAVARNHLHGSVTRQDVRVVTRQVWTVGSGDVFGNVSPDGRYIPYIAYEQGASDLYLHDLRTGANRRLTNLSPSDRATSSVPDMGEIGVSLTGEYSFSRDGKQLAYSWLNFKSNRQQIRVIGLQGSGVPAYRRLFDNEDVSEVQPHDWSPDGKWIAVNLHRKDRTAQIALVSTENGSLRVLKSVDWRGPTHMFFSPDGRYLAFDFQSDIFVLATDASREIPAVVDPSDDTMVGWSPDGTRLLFASDRAGSKGLWAVRLADGAVQGRPELIKGDIGQSMVSMGLTTSGALYSVLYNKNKDVYQATFDFAKGQFLSQPVPAAQTFVGTNRQPGWSPDGKYLAYLSRDLSVGIRSLATEEVRELSLSQVFSYVETFVWASDSNSFLLGGTDARGRRGLFRLDAQTGRIALLLPPDDEAPGLSVSVTGVESPDGKFLYFTRFDLVPVTGPTYTVVKRDLISGMDTELVRRTNLGAMVLSPDGRYIATTSLNRLTKSASILAIPTSSGEPHELMHGDQSIRVQMWEPDSQTVFIRKGSELWRAPLDGGQPSRLDVTLDPAIGPFRVHPDGRRIVMEMHGPVKPDEVWVLENFLPPVDAKK
jgi:Tol biopolymer transport system component